MTLSTHVRTLGRGPGRSRSLTREEAEDAMAIMLSGGAAPEAVGALLMLLRMKGETPDEIAGFAATAQQSIAGWPRADLDWPSYAAGRSRGLPWFLLSARLVAQAGYRVLLHGWNGVDGAVRDGLMAANIPVVETQDAALVALDSHRIAYAPLEALHPSLFALLSLRPVFGLRSCINTVSRMLNPGAAACSVQGVFHPSYRLLQADAAERLNWRALTVIKGGGGEFERNPAKDIAGFGLRSGAAWQGSYPAIQADHMRLADVSAGGDLAALWSGESTDPMATSTVLGTAAAALDTLGAAEPDSLAADLWQSRHTHAAA